MKMYIDVVVYQMPFMGKFQGKNYTGASKDPKFKETISLTLIITRDTYF